MAELMPHNQSEVNNRIGNFMPQIVFKRFMPVAPAVESDLGEIVIEDVQIIEESTPTNWVIMSFEGCAVKGLSYAEAAKLMAKLSLERIPGLYLTTE